MKDRLKLGFLLYQYFPFGGLQRDCLKTALVCARRGEEVTVFTRSWDGPLPEGILVEVLGQRGLSNLGRNRNWLWELGRILPQRGLDGVVGFNKLPDLDVYFGADPCYVAKVRRLRPAWYRWLPRYRFYRRMEEAVFAGGRYTQVLLLTDHEVAAYRQIYGTESERFHVLPPGIQKLNFDHEQKRQARREVRQEQGWSQEEQLLLFVGSGFRVKGLDRAIAALASLPEAILNRTRLIVIGKNRPGPFVTQARRAGVGGRVHFLGPRDDVSTWLLAADLLLHPAYSESAGMVLLEALTCGLPVLTTDTCGYGFHIERADAGYTLKSPFAQGLCNQALAEMLTSSHRMQWQANALAYAAREDLYSCHDRAADLIEETVRKRGQENNWRRRTGSEPI
jgi:UDP-glucose:(heptosyl)LPS alpha-1,3-glucosyltransferase